MAAPTKGLQKLEDIEKDIQNILRSASDTLNELSKEKPNIKQVDQHATQFLKTLRSVESELSQQINYLTQVSTGQPHEGCSYSSQKVLQMAWHRLQHARNEVNKLESKKNHFLTSIGQLPAASSAASSVTTSSATTQQQQQPAPGFNQAQFQSSAPTYQQSTNQIDVSSASSNFNQSAAPTQDFSTSQ